MSTPWIRHVKPAHSGYVLIFLAAVAGITSDFLKELLRFYANKEEFGNIGTILTWVTGAAVVFGAFHIYRIYLAFYSFEAEPEIFGHSFDEWVSTPREVILRSLIIFLVFIALLKAQHIFELLEAGAKSLRDVQPNWLFLRWLNSLCIYAERLGHTMLTPERKTGIFTGSIALLFLISILWTILARKCRKISLNDSSVISDEALRLWIKTDVNAFVFWALCFFLTFEIPKEFAAPVGLLASWIGFYYCIVVGYRFFSGSFRAALLKSKDQNIMNTSKLAAYTALVIAVATAGFVVYMTNQSTPQYESGDGAGWRGGKIKVAVVSAPPVTGIDPNSLKPHGYAVDVIRVLAHKAKIDLEFIPSNWDTMGAALSSGKADLIIGPIYMTEGRAREYTFTDPLFAYPIVAVVPKNSQKVRTLKQLQTPGLRIAVGRGGFDAEFASRLMPQAQRTEFPTDDPNLSALEVVAGRADLALMDLETAKRFTAGHPEVEIRFEDPPVSLQYAAFMLRREDTALRNFLNIALRNLDLSSELSAIDATYAPQKTWYGRVSLRPPLVK